MPKKKDQLQTDHQFPETPLVYNQTHRNAFFILGKLPRCAERVYGYMGFHCNVRSGVIHKLSIQQIADDLDMGVRTVYTALAALSSVGLWQPGAGSVIDGRLPHQGLINQQSKAMWHDRQNRDFFGELQSRLDAVMKGHITVDVRNQTIQAEYTKLVNERKAENKYVPKKLDDVRAVKAKLEQYASEADTGIEEDVPWTDDEEAVTV